MMVMLICVLSNLIFNQDWIKLWIKLYTTGNGANDNLNNWNDKTKRMLLLTLANMYNIIVISLMPNLFLFTMVLFEANINQITNQIKVMKKKNNTYKSDDDRQHPTLDQDQLMRIHHHLTKLSHHFEQILVQFRIPLAIANIVNIYIIISSCCCLLITHGNHKYFTSLLISFTLFGLQRISNVCWAGNLPAIAYYHMLCTCYDNINDTEWNLETWMAFVEIKKLRTKFKTILFQTFSLNQSSILTIFGFILNYIVILLQTENYDYINNNNNNNNQTIDQKLF